MDRYKNIRTVYKDFKPMIGTTKYPDVPLSFEDIYVYSTQGDRFDILANQYYNDSTLWWIISNANNNLKQDSYYIPEGTQIRIPQNIANVLLEQYKGFDKGSSKNASTLQYLNNQNAWVKMASSVYIGGAGTEKEIKLGNILSKQRLDSIGLEYSKFKGNNLAKNFILFNGVSEVNKPNKRAGITNNTQLWNSNSAYGLGGTQFGIQPIPGITGVDVECLNRGSIRRATITLQAFNKFQFEIIEMLYLRVGYHIMLEFGNDKYFDHETKTYESTGNTLIEKSWFNSTNTTQLGMLKEILTERKKYSGNYEGFFGRVTNFSWDITPEGTYSIEINLHTVGDVIESIQVNLPTPILTDADLIKSGSNSAIDTSVQR